MKKKVFTWVLVIFLLFWLITDPQGMAAFAEVLSSWAERLAVGAREFFSELG